LQVSAALLVPVERGVVRRLGVGFASLKIIGLSALDGLVVDRSNCLILGERGRQVVASLEGTRVRGGHAHSD